MDLTDPLLIYELAYNLIISIIAYTRTLNVLFAKVYKRLKKKESGRFNVRQPRSYTIYAYAIK